MFKIGDEVNVIDRAWSAMLNKKQDGIRVRRMGPDRKSLWVFKVIGVDCVIPIYESYNTANTLIQNTQTNTIWAINDCNLSLVPVIEVRFISNGQDVTDSMSEQSRRAVLNANNY